jgi:hypothetical protein
MIPTSKYDLEAVDALKNASAEEVLRNADKLLEWLQDCNWPVFEGVISKLSRYGFELYEPIARILLGTDSIWKANIVGYLIPKFSGESQLRYNELLTRLIKNPSSSDFEEGLIDFIEVQLSRNAKIT